MIEIQFNACFAATPSRAFLPSRSWAGTLEPHFAGAHGGAVLLDRRSRRVIAEHLPDLAAHPGSSLKPLVLQILLERGRLHARRVIPLPGRSPPPGPLLRLHSSAVERPDHRPHRHRLFL